MFDLAIVGGGPAGAAAAVYAARKRLKTIFITSEWGGQSTVSSEIQNWIGTPAISGSDLAKNLRAHVEKYAADCVTIVSPALITSISTDTESVSLASDKGISYQAKSLLIATGSTRRKLAVPGAEQFDQKGLTYCATCDGPLFEGKDVVVVGGGNAALETVLQLLAYCKSVILLNRSETLRADEVTIAAAMKHTNFRIIKNAETTAIMGDKFVTGLRYKDRLTQSEILIPVEGVFVEIGLLPNTEWLGTSVALTPFKQVIVDPKTQRAYIPRGDASNPDARRGEDGDGGVPAGTTRGTSGPRNNADGLFPSSRIWAAGDCTDGLYHQNNIAAGDAVKALEDIYMSLHRGT